ncbi:hypothetical protein QFC20_000482 [Naganishia adeliensis]|uniref:Uncharacterized protein n=1 Tax=Naganishia adeliensis TaxID=92952 RepID=A0ACC2X1N7_9TREE|nr:hypothetical protein QFC20_000482 [Naganishia adeliensis]
MSVATPIPLSISPLARSPASSRSPSLAGRPRKPSPLRRSSTPDESEQLRMSAAGNSEQPVGRPNDEERQTEDGVTSQTQLSSGDDQARRASEPSAASTSTAEFNKTSLSESASNLTELSSKTVGSSTSSLKENTAVALDREPSHPLPASKPISNTPIRPLRPLSTVSGDGFGSPNSVPHAGAAQAPQRQKIIVPSKSWKACFDLNLTQKELARFD